MYIIVLLMEGIIEMRYEDHKDILDCFNVSYTHELFDKSFI